MNSRLGSTFRLLDHNIWKEYKKNYPPKKFSFENREEFKSVVKEICKVISERIVNSEGGVLIQGLGYFFNWKVPNKKGYTITRTGGSIEKKYNLYGAKHMHLPTFLPSEELEGWSMDGTFNKALKRRLRDNLYQNKQYKMYPFSFKNIL